MPEAEAATSATPETGPAPAPAGAVTAAVPVVAPDGPDRDEGVDDGVEYADDAVVAAAAPLDDETARRFWGEDGEPSSATGGERRSRRRARRRARRVVRIVRHVSPWSVLKVSVPFFLCVWIVVVTAGVLLWSAGQQTGLVENAENFWAEATGQETVEWDGEVLFRGAVMAGGVMAVASTGFAVLFAMLFNLICDITGGLRFTVLEVEPPRKRPSRRERRATAPGGRSRRWSRR